MLENLHIRNLALVTELDIDFGPGLNTVTGETGAGKSLIIGAVRLLVGGRATPSVIRKGEKSCEVAGVISLGEHFAGLREELDRRLDEAGIATMDDGRLLIRRVVTENGSRAYLNGSMVTAGFLKDMCEHLIDLHGPQDNQTLQLTARQLELLDIYAGLGGTLQQVAQAHGELSKIIAEREKMKAEGLTPEEADLLEFQLKEIDNAEINPDEEDELVQRYKVASNSKHIIELAYAAQHALSEDEDSVADRIGTQVRALRELEQLDTTRGAELVAELEELSENVRELADKIGDYGANLDIDPEELQIMENRIDLIQRLKRKYGPTLQDVQETAERIRTRLDNIRGRSSRLQALAEKEEEIRARFEELCHELSIKRRQAAPGLASAIEEKLHGLGFMRAAFAISISETRPGATGADAIEFEFAANVGEDMQPLRHVASSGEIARVMLAVKTVLSEADSVPILIFDEIDANIGGRVAGVVASELKSVAMHHQVFSITHMPQIAAAGQQHYMVAKAVVDERTTTSMHLLEGEEREAEIVRMLGADSDSEAAVAHAKELLSLNN